MRITTLLLLTFAVGAGIGFGCSEANKSVSADASVEQADAATDTGAVDAAGSDAATSADAQLTDAAAKDAGSDTEAGE